MDSIKSRLIWLLDHIEGGANGYGAKTRMANRIGVPTGHLNAYLKTNPSRPGEKVQKKICQAYGVSSAWLNGYEPLISVVNKSETPKHEKKLTQDNLNFTGAALPTEISNGDMVIPKPKEQFDVVLTSDDYLKLRDSLVREHTRAEILQDQIQTYFKDLRSSLTDMVDTLKNQKLHYKNSNTPRQQEKIPERTEGQVDPLRRRKIPQRSG